MNSLINLLPLLFLATNLACNTDTQTAAGRYKESQNQTSNPAAAVVENGNEEELPADDNSEDQVVDPAAAAAARLAELVKQAKPIYDQSCMGCHQAAGPTSNLNAQTVAMASQDYDQNAAVHANTQKPSNDIFEGIIEYIKNPI